MKENLLSLKRIGKRGTMLIVAIVSSLLFTNCSEKKIESYRVGVVSGADFFLPVIEGFKVKMAELGYVEGKNISYSVHRLADDPDAERQAARKLVDEKVDLIFAVPTAATVQAKAAVRGTNIPLVFAYAGLEGSDLVESVQKPGGNLTGVCYPGSDQIAKRLEILLELAPKVKRIGITYDKNYPNTIPSLKVLRQIAMSRDLALVEVPVAGLEELKSALTDLKKSSDIGMDAVMLMPDSLNHSPQGWMEIKTFAAQYHLPLAGSFFYTVENGAVFGNSNDLFKVGELVAPLADKIFRGIPAGTIPVVTPEQDLWINYKVAQELGLTVPEDMLRRADKIIR